MDLDGAKVREEPEPAAQREQGLLRADGRGRIGPLRSADGAEEDRVGVAAGLDVLGPDRDPVRVDRDAPGHDLRPVHREPEPLSGGIDDTPRGVDDLGPDPVARDGDDSVRGKADPPSWEALAGAEVREGHVDPVDLGPVELVGRHEVGVERRFDDVRG